MHSDDGIALEPDPRRGFVGLAKAVACIALHASVCIMKTLLSLTIFSVLGLSPLMAASHGSGPRVRDINARHENEQERISRDFGNGELTAGEDKALETREAHIKKVEERDRRNDNGHLTKSDFGKLKRDENHISRTIRRDKRG